MPLLSIENICVEYRTSAGRAVVISDFSLAIERGESVGLVGESGCGKSTLLMAIMGYLGRNGAITRGRILFEAAIWSAFPMPSCGGCAVRASPSSIRSRPPH
jgi:ABC-type glutathione transport system ATPase component